MFAAIRQDEPIPGLANSQPFISLRKTATARTPALVESQRTSVQTRSPLSAIALPLRQQCVRLLLLLPPPAFQQKFCPASALVASAHLRGGRHVGIGQGAVIVADLLIKSRVRSALIYKQHAKILQNKNAIIYKICPYFNSKS